MIEAYTLVNAIVKGLKVDTMKVIAIANQKGGVGKTTTANALIAGLTEKGYRVLGVDLDPQGNLTASRGQAPKGATIFGVLTGEVTAKDAITSTEAGDLIVGSPLLSTAESLIADTGKEYRLKEALAPLSRIYDYVILDTPPSLGILTINALTACDYVVAPAQADLYSLQGIDQLTKTIDAVKKYCNHSIKVAGILLTMFNSRTRITKEVAEALDTLAGRLGTRVFDTKIRASVKASEVQFKTGGLFKYAPRATVTEDYRNWIEELISAL